MNSEENFKNMKENLVRIIKYRVALKRIFENKDFLQRKVSSDIFQSLESSKNAINEFLYELSERLNCEIDELEKIFEGQVKNVDEISSRDILKITIFLNKKKINWHHLQWALLGMTAGVLTSKVLIVVTGGVAGVVGSMLLARLLDQVNTTLVSSRANDIKRAYELLKQYEIYGEYPTLNRIILWVKNFFGFADVPGDEPAW
jgi:hypothetical protein